MVMDQSCFLIVYTNAEETTVLMSNIKKQKKHRKAGGGVNAAYPKTPFDFESSMSSNK